MIALVRYTLTVLLHTQRWVAPTLALILTTVLVWTAPPISLDSVALTLSVLFPVAAWLAYATATLETPAHEHVVTSHTGSAGRVTAAKALTALLVTSFLPVATITAATTVAKWSPGQAGLALLAVLTTVSTGCALGTLTAALLPTRPGWALLGILLIALADLLVPYAPPVHAYIAILTVDAPRPVSIVIATAGSLLSSTVLIAAAIRTRTRG